MKKKVNALSKQDKAILQCLEQDGRMSFSVLASKLNMSKTPCWNRVKALELSGFIQSYGARLDAPMLGLQIRAFVHVVVNFEQSEAFEKAVNEHDHILRCEAVTGDFDYLLEVVAQNMPRFDTLLRKELSKLPGIARFSTSIATREVKNRQFYMALAG